MRAIRQNPYKNIDWINTPRLKSEFHCHTTESDGNHTVVEMVSRYRDLGYDVVAITDHDWKIGTMEPVPSTWPWEEYGVTPEIKGNILAIQGAEPGWFYGLGDSRNQHHIVSLFSDYTGNPEDTTQERITAIQETGGICFWAHPFAEGYKEEKFNGTGGQWPAYIPYYEQFNCLLGQELLNRGPGEYSPTYNVNHTWIWDSHLKNLSPGRTIYGLATSDAHGVGAIGSAYTIVLGEKTVESVKHSLIEGKTLAVWKDKPEDAEPHINNIQVNKDEIIIDGSGIDRILWLGEKGQEVGRGNSFRVSTLPKGINYVRSVIEGANARIYTNPFSIGEEYWIEKPFVNKTIFVTQ